MTDPYPLPRFHFQVDWGGAKISFTEVTGLITEREKIEYRHSDSKSFHSLVQPGRPKPTPPLVLKRGLFANDTDYHAFYDEVADDRVNKRRDVTIRLLNEKHQPVAAWKALRCFALKVTAPDLKSDANEIAIEAIEIAHEGLTQIEI